MAGVSNGLLAAETCRAGGLGFLAAGHLASTDDIDRQIDVFRRHSDTVDQAVSSPAPLCLGFIGHSTFGSQGGWDRFQTVLDQHKPAVVQFFAPAIAINPATGRTNVEMAQEAGSLVMAQICSVNEATMALEAGADAIIVQGSEAGGHGYRRELGNGTLPLSARVVSLCRDDSSLSPRSSVPILAAGGIVDGRGLVASLALGCDGAVLGTRLWASQEAAGHDSSKALLASVQSEPDTVVRTTAMDQIQNTYHPTPWPAPYDSVGMLRNDVTEQWDGRPTDLASALRQDDSIANAYRQAEQDGDTQVAAVLCGQGVGDIGSIDGAYDIVTSISDEAMAMVHDLPKICLG